MRVSAQSSYDVCLVSAQSSRNVVQSSYDVCLVSVQSNWELRGGLGSSSIIWDWH